MYRNHSENLNFWSSEGLEAVAAVSIRFTVFWVMTPFGFAYRNKVCTLCTTLRGSTPQNATTVPRVIGIVCPWREQPTVALVLLLCPPSRFNSSVLPDKEFQWKLNEISKEKISSGPTDFCGPQWMQRAPFWRQKINSQKHSLKNRGIQSL